MINRFSKNQKYIGINFHTKDSLSIWREEINIHTWQGKPYNKYAFDKIFIFSDTLYDYYKNMAIKQGIATNREVFEVPGYLGLGPIWIHDKGGAK
jgi:hypothetical protein